MEPKTGNAIIGEHPPVRLALDEITVDETVQARAQMLGEDVVDEYAAAMREGDDFPALVVFQQGGAYILADGFTRHAAAKRAGLTTFECVVNPGGLRDAVLYAVGANSCHGHPRSNADKHSAVLKLLADDEWCGWSSHRIAQLCHVSHQLVLKLQSTTGRATGQVKYKGRYGVGTMNIRRSKKPSTDSGSAELSGSLPASANKDETDAPCTAATVETTTAALIDKSDVDDEDQVYADQNASLAKTLAILAEFLKFVLARIDCQETNLIMTVIEQDAVVFRCLCDRAELAIRTDFRHAPRCRRRARRPRSSRWSKIDLCRVDLMTNNPLPRPSHPCQCDGLGRRISWRHLVTASSLEEVSHYLGTFDSYARTRAMTYLMTASPPRRVLEIFLSWSDACDDPWPYRSYLADTLRDAIITVPLIDLLEPPERDFYSALPQLVPVWRGCEHGRVRGLSWTTDQWLRKDSHWVGGVVTIIRRSSAPKFRSSTFLAFFWNARKASWLSIHGASES